jgi:hypothetical protein
LSRRFEIVVLDLGVKDVRVGSFMRGSSKTIPLKYDVVTIHCVLKYPIAKSSGQITGRSHSIHNVRVFGR